MSHTLVKFLGIGKMANLQASLRDVATLLPPLA